MTPELLRKVALAVASSRSLPDTLQIVTTGLAGAEDIALARIWLVDEGDSCETCNNAKICENRELCLHLRSSAGRSLNDNEDEWNQIEGSFRRMPLSRLRKIGFTAVTGEPVLIQQMAKDEKWVARAQWVKKEAIVSFATQPLKFHEETLGVLGVFSRRELTELELGWLRTFADRVAAAIINSRAFEEIAQLKRKLEAECDYLRVEVKKAANFGTMIGESPALQALMSQLSLVANTDATVLLHGESGTGKELAAVALHEQSGRKDKTLVRVNCASIPRELFESEFFGHTRGSFSGAVRDRQGRFDLADGGTLFLDEVGEIPLDLQSKLLRVLQEGTFERVGDERTRQVNVRVVAATNRDLKAEAKAGRFREDLYYRLNVFPLVLPPLRARSGDIPALATHFLEQAARRMGRGTLRLTREQAEALKAYDWPGNIRELQNMMERAVILAQEGRVELAGLLPTSGKELPPFAPGNAATDPLPATASPLLASFTLPGSSSPPTGARGAVAPLYTDAEMKYQERSNFVAALKQADGKISGNDGAAALLGIKASTLASRIKKLGIEESEFRSQSSEFLQ